MKNKFLLVALLICILCGCKTTTYNESMFTNNKLVFYNSCNLPVVSINTARGPKNFLIDTGSSISYISVEYLSENGHFDTSNSKVHQFSSTNAVLSYDTKDIFVNINNEYYTFKTMSMIALNDALFPTSVFGILGNDFLRKNKVIIDYSNKTLKINDEKRTQ